MPIDFDIKEYGNKYFVETGTYLGNTCKKALDSNRFEKVISLDIQQQFVDRAKTNFSEEIATGRFEVYQGASHEILWDIISDLDGNITFWLDAHVDGSGKLKLGSKSDVENCPLYKELEIIKKHPINSHTIMIDDIRIVRGTAWGRGNEISVDGLIQRLREINQDYKMRYENGHIENDVLIAYVGE